MASPFFLKNPKYPGLPLPISLPLASSKEILELVSCTWYLADNSGCLVCGQGTNCDNVFDSGFGLDPCHQRSDVACKRVSCLQLAWVLSIPAERDHPRGDWIPSAPSPGRRCSGRDLAARIPVYRGRIVPRSWSWRHAVPKVGRDGVFGNRIRCAWYLNIGQLAFCHYVLYWAGDRYRPHL